MTPSTTDDPAATDGAGPARKRGRPTETERDRRRADVLDAATATFLASGYASTTLDEIAARARVTKRTVYTYLGDKPAVFTAVVQHLAATTLGSAPPSDVLGLATRIVTTLHSDAGVGLHRLVLAEAAQFPDLAASFYATGPQRYIDALTAALGAARGESEDPQASTAADSAVPAAGRQAEQLFTLLLGEAHRRRLLGLDPAPTAASASAHAQDALAALGLGPHRS